MRQVNPILLSQMKADSLAIQQLGSPILSCQGMLVPRGLEDYRFLIKSCPRPIITNDDPVQVQYPGGHTGIVAGPPKDWYTGTLQLLETEAAHAQLFADYIVANKGMIDCDYYDGHVASFTRAYELENCAIRFEMPEFDTESRGQVMTISCPIDFNFFGNFASIGANGTVLPGQRGVAGVEGLINRVQSVVSAAQSATNTARSALNTARQIGSLFG